MATQAPDLLKAASPGTPRSDSNLTQADFFAALFPPATTSLANATALYLSDKPQSFQFYAAQGTKGWELVLEIDASVWYELWANLQSNSMLVAGGRKFLGLPNLKHPDRGDRVGFQGVMECHGQFMGTALLSANLNEARGKLPALAYTLDMLIQTASICGDQRSDPDRFARSQGFEANLYHNNNLSGGSLEVTLSPKVAGWLSTLPPGTAFKEVAYAMHGVYEQIWRNEFGDLPPGINSFFKVHTAPNQLILNVFGNSCDLAVAEGFSYNPGRGLPLMPHNVDSYIEAITLLVGAGLLARKALDELKD